MFQLKHSEEVADKARAIKAEVEAAEAGSRQAKDQADEEATDAPSTITIAGRTLLVAKARSADLVAIRRFVQRKTPSAIAAIANDPALKLLPPNLQSAAITAAAQAQVAGGADPTESGALSIMQSPDGVAFAVWLFCRRMHPGLTLEEIRELVTEDNVDQVSVEIGEASAMERLVGNLTGRPG